MEIEKRFPKFEDLVVEKEMEGLQKQVAEGFARGYLEGFNSEYFEGSIEILSKILKDVVAEDLDPTTALILVKDVFETINNLLRHLESEKGTE